MWESAKANMATYDMLAAKAKAYREDPEVQKAFEHAGIFELGESTLAEGESFDAFLADTSAYEDVDVDAIAERDYGLVRLHQLALQHLIG